MRRRVIQLLARCQILRLKQFVLPLTIFSVFVTYHLYNTPQLPSYTLPLVLENQPNVNKNHLFVVKKEKRGKTSRKKLREFDLAKIPILTQLNEEAKVLQMLVDGPDGTNATLCPRIPATLKGRSQVRREHHDLPVLSRMFPEMQISYRPTYCRARQRLAVIVPFRKADNQIKLLLHNLIPFLQRQMLDFTILLIEQASPASFNRARLFNIGFLEAVKRREYDCFILHDVDLIPIDDRYSYTCGSQPRHLVPDFSGLEDGMDEVNPSSSDGLLLFTREQFRRINGASNLFFKDRGEVDDLYKRVYGRNMQVLRELVPFEKFKTVQNEGDHAVPFRKTALKTALSRIDDDGLNSADYLVLNVYASNIFVWYTVHINTKKMAGKQSADKNNK